MNTPPPSRPAPLHVPVLTEVVELDEVVPQATALPDQALAFPSVPVVPVNPLASPGTATPSPSFSVTSPTSAPQQTPEAPLSTAPFAQAMPFAPMAPATSSPAVPPPLRAAPVAAVSLAAPMAVPVAAPRSAPAGLSFDEAQMTQRVLVEVQRQIDGMLEYRLREALAPILARTSEALVRELRQELSKTMRDVVSRAVAQEVVRQRSR